MHLRASLFLLFSSRRNLTRISLCLVCGIRSLWVFFFLSRQSAVLLSTLLDLGGCGTRLLPLGYSNYFGHLKQAQVSKREPVGDAMTVNVSSPTFSFQNPGNFPTTKGFWHFQGTQSKGYLPAVAGLLAWVVLQIHLSPLNKSPLPLDHLVTVHDIIDFSAFDCAPCAAPSSFSLTHRLRET